MNKFLKQRKGITLVSLVVTIIILVVLAGITISLTIGQDGLIEKAKETKPIQDIATAKEQLEMLKVPTKLNTYDVNLDNYLAELDRVKEEYEVNDVEKVSNTEAEVVVGGKYKFLIKDKQNGDVEIIYQGEATELILSATSGTYIYPTPGTFEVVKNITGGELSVKSENENIAKVSISGTTVTVEPGTTTGTVEIIVTAAANGEYAEQRAVHLATVVNGEIELNATAYTGNYDGLPHNAITDVEVIPEDAKIEYSLDGGEYSETIPTVTGAKEYTVSIRASKAGYTTKTKTITVTVGKAENTTGNLVLSKTEGIITYPTQEKITVTKNISGGTLSVSSSNNEVATASIDELTGEITITPKAVNSDGQKTTITVTSSATANYAEQTATYEATVNRGIIEIEATAYTGNYDGTEHNAVTITKKSPSDVTIKYSIDGGAYSTTVPTVTGAKEYTVSIQASKAGYTTNTITKTVTVGKQANTTGNLVLSATSGTLTYPTVGSFAVTKNTSGGTLSVSSNNTNIATATIDSAGKVTITPKAITSDGQKATITVTSSATANYAEQTATYIATVNRGTIEIEATAYTGNYDGEAHDAITSVSTTPTGTTLRYKLNNGSWQTTIPQVTNASEEYTVVIEASKAGYTTKTKTITVTIGKQANITGNLVLSATSGTLTYPTAGSFTVTKNTSGGTLSVASSNTAIATASIDSAGKVTVTPGTTAGTATITVTSAATTNYEAQTAKYTATVKNGTITLEATAYTGNYDGAAHNAVTVTSKSPSDVTIKYSIDGGTYSTTVPTVTGAKEYTVSIQATKAGYTTKTISKTVTVNKAAANSAYLVLSATSGTLTYPTSGTFTVKTNTSGGTLSISSSNTNIATASISGTTVTVKPGTTAGTATITVTSAATTNYEAQTAKYTATVKNGTITLEATAYTGNYDGAAHNAVTVTSKSPSDVTIKYSIDGGTYSTTVPTVTGAKEYTVSIQATKAGYTTKTISKTVTVNKAAANSAYLVLSATSGTLTYPTSGTFTVKTNTSGGTLSVSSSNTNIATASISGTTVTVKPGTTAGTATITVTSAATTNYEAQTAKYTATVKNGTITLEANAYTGNYDGAAHNAVTVTKKSPSDVTIKYSIDGGAYSTTMPTVTNVGTYTVSIQASKAGYTTKTISKTATVDQPLYTVTYNVDTSTSYKESVKKGSTCLSPTTFTPTKSGYTFVGWRADKTASSTVLTSQTMGDSAISLYAVFKKDVKVTYYNNSTTAASSTKQAYYNNGNVANPSFTLTQAAISGWTARGWSTGTAGNSTISYNNGSAFTRDSNVTLYGMYQQTITLSYNGNGATSGSTASHTGTRYYNSGKQVYVNPTFTLNANGFAKTGYGFSKWASGSASGTQYAAGGSVTLSANTTFYAVWEETKYQLKYVVTYYQNHGGYYKCNLKKYRLDTEEVLLNLSCDYDTYNKYSDSYIKNVLSQDAQWRWSFTPLVEGNVSVLWQGTTYTFVPGQNKSGAWNYGSEYGGSANTIVPYVGNGDITVTFITENKYSE